MRTWISRVKYLTYSWTFGLGLPTPRFTWKGISGHVYVARCLRLLSALRLMITSSPVTIWNSRLYCRWSRLKARYRRTGQHRGTGRATRGQNKLIREAREVALENQKVFVELATDPTFIGVAQMDYTPAIGLAIGSRAYRQLSRSNLNRNALQIRSRFMREADYEQVP